MICLLYTSQRVKEAGPSEPALILGLNGAPAAGDTFHVVESYQEAREITNKREQLAREQGLRTQKILTLDELGRRIALGNFHRAIHVTYKTVVYLFHRAFHRTNHVHIRPG